MRELFQPQIRGRLIAAFVAAACVFLALAPAARADEAAAAAPVVVTSEAVSGEKGIVLEANVWRYRPGDDPAWAAKDFDDADWDLLSSPSLKPGAVPPSGWRGIAWFRTRVVADASLDGAPVALQLFHPGASEVYVDGRLAHRFGVVSPSSDAEQSYNPSGVPVGMALWPPGPHTIAIRYSCAALADPGSWLSGWSAALGRGPGFAARLRPLDAAVTELESEQRANVAVSMGTACVVITLALLHFLLFAFYPRRRENLYYSVFAATLFGNIVANYAITFNHPGLVATLALRYANLVFVIGVFATFLAFLHSAFAPPVPRRLWAIFAAAVAVSVLVSVLLPSNPRLPVYFVVLYICYTAVLDLWIMGRALRRVDGARIVGVGVLCFTLLPLRTIVSLFFEPSGPVNELVEFVSINGLLLSVSVYLARNFARTSRELEAQLENVHALSERQIEAERRESEAALLREQERSRVAFLEAENARRARELDEARQLQLSMLPSAFPSLPNLEIAAYMKPATEVGGDYYDFHMGEDGTLTVAIGDATGHGLKAGTMVTATKSLFKAFAREPDPARIFAQSTRVLKQMNLRSLYMAMMLLKINGTRVRVSTAGMPPLLVYHAATGEVEEVKLTGMPLGSVLHFPYQERALELEPGDAVLVMSDGFPERFNARGEMLDYAEAKALLGRVADRSPSEIIEQFVRAGDEWAAGHPQDDDVTFVVLKVKDRTAPVEASVALS